MISASRRSLVCMSVLLTLLYALTTFVVPFSGVSSNFSEIRPRGQSQNGLQSIIYIDAEDGEKNWEACPLVKGKGTYSNPFILENLVIDAQQAEYGIFIENSKFYAIIRNCTVFNSFGYDRESAGIVTLRSDNIRIDNCTLIDNFKGIFTGYGNNNRIFNCTFISNSYFGLYAYSGESNFYALNNFFNNSGIAFYDHFSKHDLIQANFITENLDKGLFIFEGFNHTIKNNYIVNNSGYGLEIMNYLNNTVFQNLIASNDVGIALTGTTSQNNIFGNEICNNSQYQAMALNNYGNYWDNGTSGNFWGDYTEKYPSATYYNGIWDTPYAIQGSTQFDHFPLSFEPEFDFTFIEELNEETDPPEEEKSIPGYNLIFIPISIILVMVLKRKNM